MGFVDKNKLVIFSKMFYNDEDIVIVSIVDGVLDLNNLTMKFIIIKS